MMLGLGLGLESHGIGLGLGGCGLGLDMCGLVNITDGIRIHSPCRYCSHLWTDRWHKRKFNHISASLYGATR